MNSSNAEGHVCESEKTVNDSLQSDQSPPLHVRSHEERTQTSTEEEENEQRSKYVKGWKLYMLTLGYDFFPAVLQVVDK